jgi:DNA-binding transcriptional MerR regulator
MNSDRFLIDELCQMTGFSRRAVRYYVENGLLTPPAGRGRGGFYGPEHVERLKRIRELLDQGLRLSAIQIRLAEEERRPSAAGDRGAAGPDMRSRSAAKGRPTIEMRAFSSGAPPLGVPLSEGPTGDAGPLEDRQGWVRYSIAPGIELHLAERVEHESRSAVSRAVEILGRMFRKGEDNE